ncbi:MarR family transcriptional regulator [uncultured Methanobrevibacter sp.]|uniref:MarR family winged helix-turn-helix transcriptional regulator n=1 Tax=uncultured Methanobrevibacter sp. TaxID=253161 RepID=UPI00260E6E7C
MSLEKFKEVDATDIPIGKFITMIGRGHALYLNHQLEPLNINASQLHSLFEIKRNKSLNQDEIARRCNVDKGSVARSIRKLEEKGLIIKKIDENNRRQNIISLSEKGEEVLEKSQEILDKWEEEVFSDLSQEEKETLQNTLKNIVIKTILFNQELKACKKE